MNEVNLVSHRCFHSLKSHCQLRATISDVPRKTETLLRSYDRVVSLSNTAFVGLTILAVPYIGGVTRARARGLGTDLTAADTVIFYDQDWIGGLSLDFYYSDK